MPWIEVNGASLRYRLEGAAGPSVVLLHELGGSLHSWDGVAPELAERCRVLRYDQRGFGASEKVREPFTLDTLVDDLEALLLAVPLEGPFHLVSVAAASMQALAFLDRDPRRVASLVFCNPAPGVDPSRAAALEAVAAQAERGGIRSILPQMLDRSFPPELSAPAAYASYRGRYVGNDPVGFALAFRVLATTDKRPSLGTIACPTLVIGGTQDVVRPIAGTEALAATIPGARFAALEGGHFLPVNNPQGLLAQLRAFLPH